MNDTAKEVQVDDATMTVDDAPVNLPEKVQVVDARNGKLIGYRDREEVTNLLDTDNRFSGFEDTATSEFMLAYNLEATKAQERETVDPFEFLKTIEDNIETAVGADDPKRMRLGVSYVDKTGRNHVLQIHIKRVMNATDMLHPGLVDAMNGPGVEDGMFDGISEKIVDFIRRKRSAKLQGNG
jgi:hypothetical protein